MPSRRRGLFLSIVVWMPCVVVACGGDDLIDAARGTENGDAAINTDSTTRTDASADASTRDAVSDRMPEDATIADAFDDEAGDVDADSGDDADAAFDATTDVDSTTDATDAEPDAPDSAVACTPQGPVTSGTVCTNQQVDPQHDGYQPGDTLSLPLCMRWSRDLQGEVTDIVVDDTFAYVNVESSVSGKSGMYGLDREFGIPIWGPVTGVSGETFISIGVDAGKVYGFTQSDHLYAFNDGGGILWVHPLPQSFGSSKIATKDGLVYVIGDESGANLYVLNGDGNLVWTSPVLNNGTNGPPTLSDTAVFLDLGCMQISARDRFDGGLLWATTPSCSGGSAWTLPLLGSELYSRGTDRIAPAVILNAADGSDAGTFSSVTTPAWNGSSVFMTQTSGVTAVDPTTGATVWTYSGSDGIASAPLVVGTNVVVSTTDGKILVLDAVTGALTGSAATFGSARTPAGNFEAPLAEADGTLYVGTEMGVSAF